MSRRRRIDECPNPNIIYGLIDPDSLMIRYIGKSCSGLNRPRNHRAAAKRVRNREETHKARWIRSLLSRGLEYEIVILDETVPEALYDLEQWWIVYGRALGWPLTNLTDGGPGNLGWKMPSETRVKIANASRGRVWSDESRARSSAASARRTPEGIARNVAAMHTPESNAKRGDSLRGKPKSEQHAARLAVPLARGRETQRRRYVGRLIWKAFSRLLSKSCWTIEELEADCTTWLEKEPSEEQFVKMLQSALPLLGIRQRDLVTHLGVLDTTVSRWVKRGKCPQIRYRKDILRYLLRRIREESHSV